MKKLLWVLLFLFQPSFSTPPLLPAINPDETILTHPAYTINFATHKGIAKWSAYILTREMTHHKAATRLNDFRADPLAGEFSPKPCAYSRSGYDKGHLVPAADMAFSQKTMSESFFMTNMSPQKPSFNRGIWKKLEDQVRKWAVEYDTLYIVSGPVMDSTMEKLSSCGVPVSIPQAFFKAILSSQGGHDKAIGFIIPNEGSKKPLDSFAVPVDWIEYQTHIDFFPELPDSIENEIESKFDLKNWPIEKRGNHGRE